MIADWIYTVDPYTDEPILLINDHIGFDAEDGQGIDGAQFMAELLCLDGMNKKRIQVWINSPGGNVLEGYNIYSAILKSKTKVDTYCVGMAASIAGVIFQAGRTRCMSDYAFLMYHNPSGSDDGKVLNTMRESIAKMTARSGKPEDEILKMMNRETYINAQEALEYGLCDEVEDSTEQNKKRLSQSPITAMYKEAKSVINSIFAKPTTQKMSLTKVTNRLQLNPEASEDAIVTEIDKIQNQLKDAQNKASEAEDKKKQIEDKMSEIENAKKDLQEQYDKLDKEKKDVEDKLSKKEKEAEDAINSAMEEECKNVLNKYAKAGKIANDDKTLAFWGAIYMDFVSYTVKR